MNRPVVVVGSLNMDLVVCCDEVPRGGQTLAGRSFFTAPGGKGANQAVAAARLGASVHMVGCVGADDFGRALLQALHRDGVSTRCVREVETETGTAVILVDASGENRIVVVSGANQLTEASQAGELLSSEPPPVVVMQLEVPLSVVEAVVESCGTTGAYVLLNAAPAMALPATLAKGIHHLVVNESEAASLLCDSGPVDTSSPEETLRAARELRRRGFAAVTVTLGSRGAVHFGERAWMIEAPRVRVQDTTGAGDAFVGTLAMAEASGVAQPAALVNAVAAGALTVTQSGALPSLPRAADVDRLAKTLRPVEVG